MVPRPCRSFVPELISGTVHHGWPPAWPAAGIRALFGIPVITDGGGCNGVISLHRADPGPWLSPSQVGALAGLARDLAAWRSWYRRTVVQDALEYVHAQGRPAG